LNLALCVMGAVLVSGCSTFIRDWDRMAATAPPQNSIEGRWEGTWKSDASGHSDRLRCILSRKDERVYEARFYANYRKALNFGYTAPLQVEQREGKYFFEGKANLHWYAGGVYHYKGEATPTNFYSTYRCKSDHGTFEMRRPPENVSSQ
jgi:hypothetical protein